MVTEHLEIHGFIPNCQKYFSYENIKSEYTPKHSWGKRTFTPGYHDETVFEIFVKSSNILSVGYNSYTEKLYVKFKDNAVYEYSKVPMSIFDELLNAESHGKYAHRNIFSKYAYRRCAEPNKKYNGPEIKEKTNFYLTST